VLGVALLLVAGCSHSSSGPGTVTGLFHSSGNMANMRYPFFLYQGTITATPRGGGKPVTVMTDSHSRFTFHLRPGAYLLTHREPGSLCGQFGDPVRVRSGQITRRDVVCVIT